MDKIRIGVSKCLLGEPVACLKDQYYLAPHPLELKLRNHA